MDRNDKSNKDETILILGCLLFVLVVWGINFFYADKSHLNNAGDSMNIVASLFSGLAFVGLIFTLFLQKKEFQENRAELARQATETQYLVKINSISNQLVFWQEALKIAVITRAEDINALRMPYFRMLVDLDPDFAKYMNEYGGYSKESHQKPDEAVKERILSKIAGLIKELEEIST